MACDFHFLCNFDGTRISTPVSIIFFLNFLFWKMSGNPEKAEGIMSSVVLNIRLQRGSAYGLLFHCCLPCRGVSQPWPFVVSSSVHS